MTLSTSPVLQKSVAESPTTPLHRPLDSLRSAVSLGDVANLLKYKSSNLAFVIYKMPFDRKYKRFELLKANGKTREIYAPCDALKLAQTRLSLLLQLCLEDIRKRQQYLHTSSHGFEIGRSIITNAQVHRRKKIIFNLDLENYFSSINFGRVRGSFIKNRDFALNESVATVIAQIACVDNILPQGSPCSPVIANLISYSMDLRLSKFAHHAIADTRDMQMILRFHRTRCHSQLK